MNPTPDARASPRVAFESRARSCIAVCNVLHRGHSNSTSRAPSSTFLAGMSFAPRSVCDSTRHTLRAMNPITQDALLTSHHRNHSTLALVRLEETIGAAEIAALPLLRRRTPAQDVRVAVEEPGDGTVVVTLSVDGEASLTLLTLVRCVWRTHDKIQIIGPLVLTGVSPCKPVPILDAELSIPLHPGQGEPLIQGTAAVPLPTFGLFNGVSLGDAVKSRVTARRTSEFARYGAAFSAGKLDLCFEFDEMTFADGPMLSLVTPSSENRVVLNPHWSAFAIDVESATLPGLELRLGWLAVAPSPVFALGSAAGLGEASWRGKLQLRGSLELPALDLTLVGEGVLDLAALDGRLSREPRFELLANGVAEFPSLPGRGGPLRLRDCSLHGWVEDDAAHVELTGTLAAGQVLCDATGVRVTLADDTVAQAVVTTRVNEAVVHAEGDVLIDLLVAGEGSTGVSQVKGRVRQAELVASAAGTSVVGIWDATELPLAGLCGWLLVELRLGCAAQDFTLTVDAAGEERSVVLGSGR